MTDWVMAGVLGVQTAILIYASAKLNKMSKMMDRLVIALIHISKDLEETIRDVRSIQDEMTELDDLIKTMLRGTK